MKKIIGVRRYDTDTAEFICGLPSVGPERGSLYRKKTGEFFKEYCFYGDQDSCGHLEPVSLQEAMEICKQHGPVTFEDTFGQTEEGIQVSCWVSDTLKQRINLLRDVFRYTVKDIMKAGVEALETVEAAKGRESGY
jgi:hypothetical protein